MALKGRGGGGPAWQAARALFLSLLVALVGFLPMQGDAAHADTGKELAPTVSKQVRAASGSWGEVDEASQGDSFDYRVVVTLPGELACRLPFTLRVVDRAPAGVDVDEGSVEVYRRAPGSAQAEVTSQCEIASEGRALAIDIPGEDGSWARGTGEARFEVRYRASLNGSCETGARVGNPNVAHAEYRGPSRETVASESATAQVCTWRVQVEKVGGGGPLAGAAFELRDEEGSVLSTGRTDAEGKLSFACVASGRYRIVETEAPEGYLKAGETELAFSSGQGPGAFSLGLSASASGAGEVVSADAASGVVTVRVADEKASVLSAAAVLSGAVPRTGEHAPAIAALLLALAALTTGALLRRHRRRASRGGPVLGEVVARARGDVRAGARQGNRRDGR